MNSGDGPFQNNQEWTTPEELRSLEAQLKMYLPREDRLDRERLIFLAGRASSDGVELPKMRLAWPVSFAAMTALAATLLVMLLTRPVNQSLMSPPEIRLMPIVRNDLAFRAPMWAKQEGISTATIYDEEQLDRLLNDDQIFLTRSDTQHSPTTERPPKPWVLTPSSWGKLFEEASPMN